MLLRRRRKRLVLTLNFHPLTAELSHSTARKLSRKSNSSSSSPLSVENHKIQALCNHHPNPQFSHFPTKGFSAITSELAGRALHAILITTTPTPPSVFHTNTLMAMYSNFHRLHLARYLFYDMPIRNTASWSTIISVHVREGVYDSALQIFCDARRMNIKASEFLIASTVTACARSGRKMIEEGFQIHGFGIKIGLIYNAFVVASLLCLHRAFGLVSSARTLFDEISRPDLVLWTSMIGCYASEGLRDDALRCFNTIRRSDYNWVDSAVVSSVLSACGSSSDVRPGEGVHGLSIKIGLNCNTSIRNNLIVMYSKGGEFGNAETVFRSMPELVLCTSMIACYAREGRRDDALRCFNSIRQSDYDWVDSAVVSSVLSAFGSSSDARPGEGVHGLAIKLGLDSNTSVGNTLIVMYSKAGEFRNAETVFRAMPELDFLTMNSMISSCSRHGKTEEARRVFHEMLALNMKPNSVTFLSLLSGCSHSGLVTEGLAYFSSMKSDFGIAPISGHCVCVVDLLGRAGRLSEAEKFIGHMVAPATASVWRSLLASCQIHGDLVTGKKAAAKLVEMEPWDDSVYVLYSNICAGGGRFGEMENVRSGMVSGNVMKKTAYSSVKKMMAK